MTEERKQTPENQTEFDMSACLAMMKEMMAGAAEGCDCAQVMSQFADQEEIPEEWPEMMSQMMAMFSGPQEETKEAEQEA